MSKSAANIYLDHNSTTPVSDAALAAMMPFLLEGFANPSSIHVAGEVVRRHFEDARAEMAAFMGIRAAELYFTSGATESINWALRGALDARPGRPKVVVTAVEHSATLDVARHLEARGHPLVVVPVDPAGRIDEAALEAALDDRTGILSIIWANNETGVLFDVERLGRLARAKGVFVHVDGVQKIGKGMPPLADLPIDLLSFSGHKFGAPKGVGGLYVRRGTSVRPLIWGGHHETGRRGGTENVPGVIAMAAALTESELRWPELKPRLRALRDDFEADLISDHPDILVNGAATDRNENTLNVAFRGIEGHGVVLQLAQHGVFCSSGSACTAHDSGPSHVLAAMAVPGDHIHGAVRFSLGAETTPAMLARCRTLVAEAVASLRRIGG